MTEKDPWYTNKELFEMINDLKIQLAETTKLIKQYNGLRKKQENFDDRLFVVEKNLENIKESKKDKQWLLGWIVATVSLIYTILKEMF